MIINCEHKVGIQGPKLRYRCGKCGKFMASLEVFNYLTIQYGEDEGKRMWMDLVNKKAELKEKLLFEDLWLPT